MHKKLILPKVAIRSTSTDNEGKDELAELDKQHIASTRKTTHCIKICALFGISLIAFIIVFVYTWHLLTPSSWRWLVGEDVRYIEKTGLTIIVGVVSTLATGYFLTSRN